MFQGTLRGFFKNLMEICLIKRISGVYFSKLIIDITDVINSKTV